MLSLWRSDCFLGRLCPQCKHYRRAAKRLEPFRLPQYLVIHFKRFYYKGPWREKIDRPVAFPTRYDTEDYAQPEAGQEAERRFASYATLHAIHLQRP